jgi:hypothetical protein
MLWHHMIAPYSGLATCGDDSYHDNKTMHEEEVTCVRCLDILEAERTDNEEFQIWLHERDAKVKA